MKSVRAAAGVIFAILGLSISSFAQAQATRTWVSGVGDDVNPCSRTAPCKTFAGAISKTATGGEISVLDPGGYGAVTITKSITIDGGTGAGWASIVNSLTNGITINAGAGIVTLRNISINGGGNGLNGIRILAAARVIIENVQIFGNTAADPNGRGITDQRSGGQLFISNTVVSNNSQSGIVIVSAAAGATIDGQLRNVQSIGNGNSGLVALLASNLTVSNSVFSGNFNYGIYVEQASGTTQLFVSDSTMSDNSTGLQVGAGAPQVRLSNNTITNNNTGIAAAAGVFSTLGNNTVTGNLAGNGPFSFAVVNKQ
jgi:parallel beta-helix repeat protein